jgi:hypothetical protein
MSADNGIYVGKFPTQEGSFEFRVIHAQAIDNLWCMPDSSYGENPRSIVEYFSDAPVWDTFERASRVAQDMADEILKDDICPILEYGISYISFQNTFKYYLENKHKIVYPWDKKGTRKAAKP